MGVSKPHDPKLQLPLSISLPDEATLSNFVVGPNEHVLMQIYQAVQKKGERFIYIWGASGAGRSHLLQAACQKAHENGFSSMYLQMNHLKDSEPKVLNGLESLDLICLDDIQKIATDPRWEESLFHFYNRIRDNQGYLIISGNSPIQALNIQLNDLRSRLSWGVVYVLKPLNDEQKLQALQACAKTKGLLLSDEVGHFLLNRCMRNLSDLIDALVTLDNASLAAQRRLTIPFVKEILNV